MSAVLRQERIVPSIRDVLRRARRAEDLLRATGSSLETWMLWAGWCRHVGCDECFTEGTAAACWGVAGCHGYDRGCGCVECNTRDVRAIAGANGGSR